jgi:phosphate transport system protein
MIIQEPAVGIELSSDQLTMMSKLVQRALDLSLKSLFEQDILLARNVIESDKPINSYEIDIDNSTFGLLAFSRIPPEILRMIIAIQKINAMLERIGDHAVNIAESAISLTCYVKGTDFLSLPEMADKCKKLLNDALKSFFGKDTGLAQEVCGRDDEIDTINKDLTNKVQVKVLAGEISFEAALDLVRVSKNLERIADLSTNIAEEAIFASIGRIIKHNKEDEFDS